MIKIYVWDQTSPEQKKKIMDRAQADMNAIKDYVAGWLEKVRLRGDEAVLEYTRQFDNKDFTLDQLRVDPADIEKAYRMIRPEVLESMREQIRISKTFAETQAKQLTREWQIETVPGVITGSKMIPIDAVGLYVPAGKAPLPTVAQILTVAAKAAGVPRKVVCFAPTDDHNEIIVAANEAGADEIYRVGGIAAIGALTYGTASIKKVYKIVGPGNPYVQAAKLQVFGKVGIDMLSGPSEALILADETSNPRYLAADILARCEHGSDSAGVVVTYSENIAKRTREEVEAQAPLLSRQKFVQEALDRYSAIVLVENEDEMIEFANEYSAEHLEIQTQNPQATFERIRNAGSVFLGNWAPVAVGDYASGTNHCLPTGVAPKFASPVGVETFLRNIQFQSLTEQGLKTLKPIVETLADVEGLDAHKRSVQIRFEQGR